MNHDYIVQSSGNIAATTGIQTVSKSIGARYHGGYAISDGTNTCVVTVYHGTAATSGNEIDSFSIPASTVPPQKNALNVPIECPDGIFVVVTGTGAKGNIMYSFGA
jgi:hypothetical protein